MRDAIRSYILCIGQCPETFATKYALQRHTLRHVKEAQARSGSTKLHKCLSPGCGRQYVTKSSLTLHMTVAHGEQTARRYPCDKCKMTFKTSQSMKKHRNFVHGGGAFPFVCPVAGCETNGEFLMFVYFCVFSQP